MGRKTCAESNNDTEILNQRVGGSNPPRLTRFLLFQKELFICIK